MAVSVSILFLLGLFGIPQPSSGKPASSDGNSGCPWACPEGWVRFGYTENCYKLPAQPVKQDTFWNHQRRCKEMEPTSYIAVIDSLAEQAVGTPVALEYSANWILALGNGFLWLGGYTDQRGWKFLDGTDQSGSPLMIAANIIGSQKNDTCLGADIKTLGLWQTRPCSDKTGAAICEMPKRRVCGRTGGMLPISPIYITPGTMANLFPKLPSIPYIGQIFGESALDDALTGTGSALTCWLGGECKNDAGGVAKPEKNPEGCRLDCPAGWVTWNNGPNSHCYLLPDQNRPDADSFWNMEAKCKRGDSSAHISMINGLLEQAMATAIANAFSPKWKQQHKDGILWLGAYTNDRAWRFLDGSDDAGNLLMSMANLPARAPGSFRNGTCLGADLSNAGGWFTAPCDRKNGLAMCEMPKKLICGKTPGGSVINFPIVDLTPEKLKQLFPRSPNVPFLSEVLDGRSQVTFDPSRAAINNRTGVKLGDAVANILCAKAGSSSGSKPDWAWLFVNGNQAKATGQWTQVKCKSGTVDAFKVQASTYLSAWSRCYNKGYDVAMAAGSVLSILDGWHPFQVADKLAEYYREDTSGLFGMLTSALSSSFSKVGLRSIKDC